MTTLAVQSLEYTVSPAHPPFRLWPKHMPALQMTALPFNSLFENVNWHQICWPYLGFKNLSHWRRVLPASLPGRVLAQVICQSHPQSVLESAFGKQLEQEHAEDFGRNKSKYMQGQKVVRNWGGTSPEVGIVASLVSWAFSRSPDQMDHPCDAGLLSMFLNV